MTVAAPPRPTARALLPLLVAAILATAIYVPMLGHELIWDDYVQIAENPAVRDGVPAWRYFVDRDTTSTRPDYNTRIYRPLRNLAMHGLWRLSDAAPAHRTVFFHGANLILYLLGAWIVFSLALRSCGDPAAAAVGAGLWLLLPVHAEDVLYASAFGDLLSMVLQLGGLYYAMAALDDARPTLRPIAGSLLCFLLAVFVKEMAVTSVLLLPAYVLLERRALLRSERGRVALLVLGHAVIAVGYLAIRTFILRRVGQGDVSGASIGRALLYLPWLTLLNLRVAVQPLGHAPDYGPDLDGVVPAVGAIAALAVVLGLAFHRGRRGLAFGAAMFVLALLPVLQLLPMWTLLADRFLLVPSVGLALVVAAALASLPTDKRPLLLGLAATAGLVCSAGLYVERGRFADDTHFWAYAVETVPDAALSHHNLGIMMLRRGDPARAVSHLEKAYDLGRRHPLLYLHLAGALEGVGRVEDAEKIARLAIERDPDAGTPWAQLASLQRRRGDLEGARRSLQEAERRHCPEPTYLRQEAPLLVAEGKLAEALRAYRRLVELSPNDEGARKAVVELTEGLKRQDAKAPGQRF